MQGCSTWIIDLWNFEFLCSGLITKMTTLSLISRNCGSQGGNSDRAIESGLETCIHKDFFAGGLLIGSVRRLNGVWLKNLGSPRIESRNRFHVVAKIRKGKKHDYPWPDDIDPNLSSGHLSYLSYFKPLKEKPKPVTLAFEKPLVDLEKKIVEVCCFWYYWSSFITSYLVITATV